MRRAGSQQPGIWGTSQKRESLGPDTGVRPADAEPETSAVCFTMKNVQREVRRKGRECRPIPLVYSLCVAPDAVSDSLPKNRNKKHMHIEYLASVSPVSLLLSSSWEGREKEDWTGDSVARYRSSSLRQKCSSAYKHFLCQKGWGDEEGVCVTVNSASFSGSLPGERRKQGCMSLSTNAEGNGSLTLKIRLLLQVMCMCCELKIPVDRNRTGYPKEETGSLLIIFFFQTHPDSHLLLLLLLFFVAVAKK